MAYSTGHLFLDGWLFFREYFAAWVRRISLEFRTRIRAARRSCYCESQCCRESIWDDGPATFASTSSCAEPDLGQPISASHWMAMVEPIDRTIAETGTSSNMVRWGRSAQVFLLGWIPAKTSCCWVRRSTPPLSGPSWSRRRSSLRHCILDRTPGSRSFRERIRGATTGSATTGDNRGPAGLPDHPDTPPGQCRHTVASARHTVSVLR